MKVELLGSVSAGFFAVIGTWLTSHGTSWEVAAFALLGAIVALMMMEPFMLRKGLAIMIFNLVLGVFGVPLALRFAASIDAIGFELASTPQTVFIVLAFLTGWTAHHLFVQVRQPLIDVLVKVLGGFAKPSGGQK